MVYGQTSSDESEVEQNSAEHSEAEQSSSSESEESGPIPSTSKGLLSTHKRRNQMRVREDRKKSRPDEKILPNLLIEKVGRKTMVGLDLTAIPIRDLGGRNPRRILLNIISLEEKPSSGQAKLVLWDADARDEEKIEKIMNQPIFIESSWINWYHGFKGEYQIKVTPGFDIVLLKDTTKICLEGNDGEIQEKRIKKYHNKTEREGEILVDETEDSDESGGEEEKEDSNESDTGDDKSEGSEGEEEEEDSNESDTGDDKSEGSAESDDNCEGDMEREQNKNKAKVGMKVIYFDLETTGFGGQICYMAFLSSEGSSKFTKFLIPECPFNPMATKINKMNVLDGKLYKGGEIVDTAVPIEKGLKLFVDWLAQLIENNNHGKIVLVSTYLSAKYITKLLFLDCEVIVIMLLDIFVQIVVTSTIYRKVASTNASHFEARLVYNHTQKPDLLIRSSSRL